MISASDKAKRTKNPIRAIVDYIVKPLNHPKSHLDLSIGDPTKYGNLECPLTVVENVRASLETRGFEANGYGPSIGLQGARKAIVENYKSRFNREVAIDDVIICSGCSGALELAISVFLNPGDNILLPRPGFSVYQVIADSLGAESRYYDLLADNNWECDFKSMESLIDSNTKAILVNNPSNPCGSNYSREHLREIALFAKKHSLPIIADEIYGGIIFDGVFTALSEVGEDIPILSVNGIAKQFVVPGWRVGWIVILDTTDGKLREIKRGLHSLSQIILGANTLIQSIIPKLLCPAPGSNEEKDLAAFHEHYLNVLRANSNSCEEIVSSVPGLSIIKPSAAMYTMIGIDMAQFANTKITNDIEFANRFLEEENVFVLPGQCFGMKNYIRLVICMPNEMIREALNRLKEFCLRNSSS